MRNFDKYKTAEERRNAFLRFCDSQDCASCPIERCEWEHDLLAAFSWLDLEAEEEKPLPCPFCGCDVAAYENVKEGFVECKSCQYQSRTYAHKEEAIAAHNRVAKAVMESEAKE